MQTTTRNATLADLAALLSDQQARKVDLVAPADRLRAVDGNIVVTGADPIIEEDGVTEVNDTYRPTAVFDEGVADKLRIPVGYVRRMRAERPDLWDANVNGWLHGRREKLTGGRVVNGVYTAIPGRQVVKRPAIPGDSRAFMLRAFRPEQGDDALDGMPAPTGVARALLSDRYARMDNFDVLTACLDGVRQAGVNATVHSADLTDRRMVVRVVAEEVRAVATELLRGYRSPFTGLTGTDNPVMFAGFEIGNSETGGGAFSITPRAVVEVCANGMKINVDCMRAVHTGGRLDHGVIDWSEETQRKHLALITSKARDAVTQFLNVEYLERTIVRLTEKAGRPVEKPEQEVKALAKGLGFTEEHQDAVLGHFIRGGQMTLGGVVNAITAHAQEVPDGDTAYDLETKATSLLGV
jgi:hypothetical protein